MYYLRKEPYNKIIPKIVKTNGVVIPEYTIMTDDMAIYKDRGSSHFYRGYFNGISGKYHGIKVYTCNSLKYILKIREMIYGYCGEWFDVYDENAKINIEENSTNA